MTEQTANTTIIQSAPPEIISLVDRFTGQIAAYKAGRYNETQLRRDFLDPLFDALGWDMTNRKNLPENLREVIDEVSVEVEGHAKAADYAFQTSGKVHFFLEAKKPSVNIETNPYPAFQIKTYAWSKKLPVSIVSDFEQLAVYDCRFKPVYGDQPQLGRVRLYSYPDYVDKWDDLYRLFSFQSVKEDSLVQFASSLPGKKATIDVDDAFLLELERWRDELARNLALRNPSLTQPELNHAVQSTIDRIVFLRICEDRGIEPENSLRDATDGIDAYGDLLQLFKQADKKYNSGLFHFSTEKGQSSYPDSLTPSLKIDDKVLKDILGNLYPPKSPYAFNYFSSDILGQVYERFLGKVIRLTAGHQAKVEPKPEVRKAGGVYYTPTYIVDYIVKNTVGELLKDRDPETLKTTPMRVLDPACGSGSFLIGAYQYLLDWYLDWYVQHDPTKWSRGKNPPIYEVQNGWKLTMEKKKDILTSHIFGVDIDAQAVEVTKLSLLLKVVENPGQLSLLGERILPDLGANIKCGNSLIAPDFYDNQQQGLFDTEEQYRVNAFDWHTAFPEIFRNGGFDAVIGNPPYGIVFDEIVKLYLEKAYFSFVRNNDTYTAFIEKSLILLRQKGLFGFIIPNTLLLGPYFNNLKNTLLINTNVLKIIDFGLIQIFNQPNVFTSLLFFEKYADGNKETQFSKIQDIRTFPDKLIFNELERSMLTTLRWAPQNSLFSRLISQYPKLDELALVKDVGLNYWTEGRGKTRGGSIADRVFYEGVSNHNQDLPYLKGRDISRYEIQFSHHWLRHDYKKMLDPKIDTLRFSPDFLLQEKIVYRQTADHIIAGLDFDKMLTDKTVHVVILREFFKSQLNLSYLLGLLNSRLLSHLYKEISQEEGRTFAQVKIFRMKDLPIRNINFFDSPDVIRHDRMVKLVETMLSLHKRSAAARLPDEKERLQRQIQTTDRQIDKLVYELYNLTPAEIAIVEGS